MRSIRTNIVLPLVIGICNCLFLSESVFGQGQPAPVSTKRTWTDASGQFKIEAEFISLKDDQIELKRADGKIVTLPLDKLAAADQIIAKGIAAALAKSAAPVNPFEANVTETPKPGVKPGTAPGNSPGIAKEVALSIVNAPAVTLDAPATWGGVPNPSAQAAPTLAARMTPIPARGAGGRSDFFEGATNMIVDTAHNWLWINIKNEPPGGAKSYRLERMDLVKGAALAPIPLPSLMKPLCVDPSGKYLAVLREDDFHNRSKQLDLWEIDGDEVKPWQTFKPYDRGDGKPHSINSVKWGQFVDATHLLTLSDNGTLAMWNMAGVKCEWIAELGNWSTSCALSPGRKQLAVSTSTGVWLLDAIAGNVLGKFEMKDEGAANLHIYRVGFSDDGAQVAALGPLNLWTWNVADGKNTASISGTTMPVGHEADITFGQRGHILLDHCFAFDVARGVMTCHYVGGGAAVHYAGREFFLTEDRTNAGKVRSVVQFALPGQDVVAKAASIKEEELLAIKPGAKIALVLNLPFDAAEIEKIRASAIEKFKANGWVVVPDGEASDFVLNCTTSVGESKEISYRTFGRGFGTEKVTVTYQHGEMTLQAPDAEKPVWQSKTTWGPPHFLHLKEGQSLEEATRTVPSSAYFANPAIPRRLMKYPNGFSIVTASVSPQGVKVQ